MIPKIIHYCWFGGNPKPKLAEKCIKSWKKHCTGYEIIEWNENNYDLSAAPLYVRQAYEAKKWAFVTDYVRLQVVYENGGIYLDTDVEILRPLDVFLQHKAFFGFEDDNYIATGLGFGAEKGALILREMMDDYADIPFIAEDGTMDITPCPKRNEKVFIKHGLVKNNEYQILDDDILICPSEYFCPFSWKTKKLKKSRNTYTIHWFSASWWDEQTRKYYKQGKYRKILHFFVRFIRRLLGEHVYDVIKHHIKRN